MKAQIALGAVVIAALAGCGLGTQHPTAATLAPEQAAAARAGQPAVTVLSAAGAPAEVVPYCKAGANAFSEMNEALAHRDAATVKAAAYAAQESILPLGGDNANPSGTNFAWVTYPSVANATETELQDVLGVASTYQSYAEGAEPWSDVELYIVRLATNFENLAAACSTYGVTIYDGGSPVTRTAARGVPSIAATPAQSTPGSPAPSASGMSVSVPGQVPAEVKQDCIAAVNALNSIAGPLEQQDAAGLIAAGNAAKAADVSVGDSVSAVSLKLVNDAEAVLGEVVGMGAAARNYEDGGTPWPDVTARELPLADNFLKLESLCLLAGVNIEGSTQPVESFAPSSVGCPSSAQLMAAWDAAPASARDSWASGVTGFSYTQCWHQWVVTQVTADGNGPAIFTDTDGHLALFPETKLSEFEAGICWVPGAPGRAWGGPAGPAACP